MSATRSIIPRPPADFLRALYVGQQLGCPDIGRLFERDAKTVHYWLRQACIPTRSRGTDKRQHFKRGHQIRLGATLSDEAKQRIGAATRAQGRVAYMRNGQHWLHTVDADQNPNWKGGSTPERQEFYRSSEWKAACCAVWQRADARCQRCDLDWRTVDRKVTPTFHVHHVVSFQVKELRADPNNLVLLCRPCHLFVHSNANVAREFLPQEPAAPAYALFAFSEEAEAA